MKRKLSMDVKKKKEKEKIVNGGCRYLLTYFLVDFQFLSLL